MPTPDFNSQLFAGTAQLISAGNAIAQSNINKSTRKWNDMMYDKQRLHAMQDWERTNEYNSPQAMMARLKAAGLNPNLVYGNGNAVESAGPIRSSDTGSWKPEAPQIGTEGLGMLYDLEMKNAQMDNLAKQGAVLEQDALLRASQVLATNTTTDSAKFDLEMKNRLKEISAEAAAANLSKIYAEKSNITANTHSTISAQERAEALQEPTLEAAFLNLSRMRSQNLNDEKQRAEADARIQNLLKDGTLKEWEIRLNRKGLQKGDAIYWRVLGNMLDKVFNFDMKKPLYDVKVK